MVEQAHTSEGHDDAVFVALLDDQIIPDGATGLGNIGNAGGIGPLDVVGKGEEGIGAQGNPSDAVQEGPLFNLGQPLRLAGEVILPDAVGAHILFVAVDVAVNHIVPVGAAQILPEGKRQGLGMLPQEPGVGLGASQAGAGLGLLLLLKWVLV